MGLNKRLIGAGATAGAGGLVPSEHFGVVLYEGDGAAGHSINGGKFGAGAYFNGSNSGTSGVVLTNLNDTLAGNSFSISLWVNCSSTQTGDNGEATIIGSAGSSSVNGFDIALKPTTGYLFFNFGNPNNDTVSTTDLRDDTWHHIVFTYTSSQALLYLDGNLLLTENSPNSLSSITNEITLGKWATGSYYALTGKIDQVRIFQKELSSSQVSTLYAETAATVESLDPLNVDTTDTLQVLGDTSCVALYRLENNEDDKSGNYNGTGTQVQYAAGRYGQGAIFSDSDSKINIPDNFGAEGETVSYSLWFKTTSANGSYMFAKRTGNNTFHIRIDNSFSPAGKICVNNWAGTAQSANNAQSTNGGYNDGGWHHFVFTYDGNQTTKTKCFIDGVYDSGMDWTYDLNTQSVSGGNNIGNYDLGSSNFSGTIDQVRVFNKTLSASEVTTLYNENPLVASYRFEGNSNDDMRTYDGTASNVSYEYGLNFTPDFVWMKQRTYVDNHYVMDSTRGAAYRLHSNLDAQSNGPDTNRFTSFDTGGFTLGNDASVNQSGQDYVAWCWKANGGTTSSNTDGTNIDSTVQVNADAGFSIVKFTTPSTFSASNTVGHGLGVIPDLIIMKSTSTAGENWMVHHTDLGNGGYIRLNTTGASGTAGNLFTGTTSTVFNPADTSAPNISYIAYCFHSVDGFSKFGSYTGNASDVGPIVETGFEPAFLMIKRTSASDNWVMIDNKRSTTNPRNKFVWANKSDAESTFAGTREVNFYSNSFQPVSDGSDDINDNNAAYIYMAFAADPDTEAPTLAKSFSTVTYTGNSTSNRTIDTGFDANFIWIKKRNATESHVLVDSLRPGSELYSNATNAQSYYSDNPKYEKGSNGFIVGNTGGANGSGNNYVAWAWKADDNEPTIFGGPARAIYKFEDNANDVTGNNNASSTANVTYTSSGKFNKAAVFNGSTSKVILPNGSFQYNELTISVWVKPAGSGNRTILDTYGVESGSSKGYILRIDNSTGKARFVIYNGDCDNAYPDDTSCSNVTAAVSTSAISTSEYTHIVVTMKLGELKMYINGELDVSTITQSIGYKSSALIRIGFFEYSSGAEAFYNGEIDQLRIYNGVVSDIDVAALYAETVSDNDDLTLGAPPKSIVSANANAGFSIVKYDGTGVSGTKVPHGLSATPNFVIYKRLDSSANWIVKSTLLNTDDYLALSLTDKVYSDSGVFWNGTAPTSTVFTLGNSASVNASGGEYIAYCFHDITGYQKFGTYTGIASGNVTVTTGFRPDFVMVKCTSHDSTHWEMHDSVRTFGTTGAYRLRANESSADGQFNDTPIKYTSTGFYLDSSVSANSYVDYDANGRTYIYWAIKIN